MVMCLGCGKEVTVEELIEHMCGNCDDTEVLEWK